MKTSALLMMVITYSVITFFTIYYFVKVVNKSKK
jgi:hypothetical protein